MFVLKIHKGISKEDTDMEKPNVGIVGLGIYLPKNKMTAAEISAATGGNWTEDAVINKLGIVEKYVPSSDPCDGTQEMGALAALDCLKNTGVDPLEIDAILCITEEWKEYPLTTSACYVQDRIGAKNAWGIDVQNRCCTCVSAMKMAKDAGQLDKEARDLKTRELNAMQDYRSKLVDGDIADEQAFEAVKGWFGEQVAARKALAQECSFMFDNAFNFLEQALSQSQELVMFVTEVTAGHDTSWFVENFGCEAYFRHNKALLFDETQQRIRDSIAAAREGQPPLQEI